MSESFYWRGAAEDEAMQDEHGFVWQAMLDTIDTDLAGKRVLDAGCNRGGFLRRLVDQCAIAEGFGYDPAPGAIGDARRLAGGRPLRFEVSHTVPTGWRAFDAAFSHEVLYLLHDVRSHAESIFAALRPGASYYAVTGVHTRSPLMVEWHAANAEALGLPKLYDLDEFAVCFQAAGFDVAVARLAVRFIPARGHTPSADGRHHEAGGLIDWLEYYSDQKVLLRLDRPMDP
jgi:SAM-dependent methyltransferase